MSMCELSKSISFLTGSRYVGALETDRVCMQGFGCYTFPDGSKYRGYFRDGMFHGFGHIELMKPQKFTIKGLFEKGHLIGVVKMIFCDGLCVSAEPKGNGGLDFTEWGYCKEDRRYLREIANGLKAVQTTLPSTRLSHPPDLLPDYYDTEEGIYNSRSGFIFNSDELFGNTSRFVPCADKTEWIKKTCRAGRRVGEVIEPIAESCQKIIETNIRGQKWANLNLNDECAKAESQGHHKYFIKLCNLELDKAGKTMKCPEKEYENVPSDERGSGVSCSSFLFEKPKETQLFERICGTSKLVYGSEGSVSVNMSMLNMIKAVYGRSVTS